MYERLILNRIAPSVDRHLIKEQAGFRPGKSCCNQLLNLTQHIEDGYQRGMITGAAFVDLSAAYDTVNHILLIWKLYDFTEDSPLCRVIQNMLSSRIFYVKRNNGRSRWRNQKNGLPQSSVLSPILFIIYANDQPLHDGTRTHVYADDLCVRSQYQSFTGVEHTIEEALDELTTYYRSNSLRANPDKYRPKNKLLTDYCDSSTMFICLCETFLHVGILVSDVQIPDSIIVRSDRVSRPGGGVCLYFIYKILSTKFA